MTTHDLKTWPEPFAAPPDFVIRAAVEAGARSPCAKSKRGAVIFCPATGSGSILSTGFNGQPEPFTCTGDVSCQAACGKLCVHAEQRAIREGLAFGTVSKVGDRWRLALPGRELVHAKVVDGALVAGGGPSCLQCSTAILDAGLAAVWLYEAQRWHHEIPCGTCNAITRVEQGAGSDGVCQRCWAAGRRPGLLAFDREKTIYDQRSGAWRRYTAIEFHEATARHHGLTLEARP